MKKLIYSTMLMLVLACGIVGMASAEEGFINADHNPATKLARGITNGVTCWVEVPKQIFIESKKYTPFIGIPTGTIKGVAMAVARAAFGVYDVATFVFPSYELALMQDEYVFENWE